MIFEFDDVLFPSKLNFYQKDKPLSLSYKAKTMKKNRLILYSTFGALLLSIFIISFYVDIKSHKDNDLNYPFLLNLSNYIWILKYCTLVLLIMFITGIVLHVRDNRRNKKLHDIQINEITELKAKLYDKGISKTSPSPTSTP
jgi:uncharacterized BrkB/YihY/UPF0761 family membrane protein